MRSLIFFLKCEKGIHNSSATFCKCAYYYMAPKKYPVSGLCQETFNMWHGITDEHD